MYYNVMIHDENYTSVHDSTLLTKIVSLMNPPNTDTRNVTNMNVLNPRSFYCSPAPAPRESHVLFKFDECYKIISNCDNIVDIHKKVYGSDITYVYVDIHPNMMINNATDEYGFFINEQNDINELKMILDNYYKQITEFKTKFPIQRKQSIIIDDLVDKSTKSTKSETIETPANSESSVTGYIHNDCAFKSIWKNCNLKTYICFNNYFYNIMMISETIVSQKKLQTMFPELKLIHTCTIKNDDMKNEIYNKLKHLVNTDDMARCVNNIMNTYLDFPVWPKTPAFDSIKTYIQSMYNITSNVENKVQFSVLTNSICFGMHYMNDVQRAAVIKILPHVLIDLGLNKKRYSQGIFWYGLTERVKPTSLSKSHEHVELPQDKCLSLLQDYIKQRDDFITNRPPYLGCDPIINNANMYYNSKHGDFLFTK